MENEHAPDDSVRVVSGPYQGVVGRFIGPAVGGDLCIEATDVSTTTADVREREVLYIWPTEVEP
jgi:hypothetical protein